MEAGAPAGELSSAIPHSAGPRRTIDRILVDLFLKPEDPALLIEKPFRNAADLGGAEPADVPAA